MKIHKGDQVLIISGKHRTRKGKILRVLPKERRVVVQGINLVKRHQKAKKTGEKGQIVEMPLPMDVSNVKLICPKCSKATRTASRNINEKKFRICKKCDQAI